LSKVAHLVTGVKFVFVLNTCRLNWSQQGSGQPPWSVQQQQTQQQTSLKQQQPVSPAAQAAAAVAAVTVKLAVCRQAQVLASRGNKHSSKHSSYHLVKSLQQLQGTRAVLWLLVVMLTQAMLPRSGC
jgi:hypothetical protein